MDNDLRYLYNSRPPSANYDHSQGPPEAINPQGSFNRSETQPRFQWAPHAAGLPQPYPHPIQPATLPDQYMAHAGGLPPPYIGFHGAPGPDVLSGGFSNRLFYYPPHRLSVHSAVPNPSHQSPPSSQGQALDGGSLNQPPSSLGDRAPNLHQPLPTPNNPSTAPPSMQAASSQPPQPSPSFAPLTQSFTPFTSSYRRHHHSPSARSYPIDGSHNTIPRQPIMPMGSRRAARSRRAANTATSRASESAIDEYEDLRQIAYDRMSRHKQAATSSKSIQSLQSVNLQDLPADERNCCICYNEFGVPSPEGITESPLRMPRCQHVFGDTCIKKWLEGSDTCPYCRDKIEPEPKHKNQSTARTFVNLLRVRGLAGPHGGPPNSSTGRSAYGREQSESNPRAGSAERRSPSEDFEEPSRRIRQRRHNPTRDEGDMPHMMQGRPPSIPSTPVLVASHLVSGSVNMESPAPVDGLPSTMQLSAASRNPLSPSAPHFWPTDYSQRQMGIRESVHLSVDINAQQALPNPLRFSGGASLSGPRNNENARPQFLPNGEENPDSIEVAP